MKSSKQLPAKSIEGPDADGVYKSKEYFEEGNTVTLVKKRFKKEKRMIFTRKLVDERERAEPEKKFSGISETYLLSLKTGGAAAEKKKNEFATVVCKYCCGPHLTAVCPFYKQTSVETRPTRTFERDSSRDDPCIRISGVYDKMITESYLQILVKNLTGAEPTRVSIVRDHQTGDYRGFAFMNFLSERSVDRVLEVFADGHLIHEAHVNLRFQRAERRR